MSFSGQIESLSESEGDGLRIRSLSEKRYPGKNKPL